MKLLSETYKELGIAFAFPIRIEDSKGAETYYENSDGFCHKREFDANGNVTYCEDSNGYYYKWEYDANGKETYYESSDGCFWEKWEYDSKGNSTYFENSKGIKEGTPRSAKTCEGKVVEVDGIKYKLTAL